MQQSPRTRVLALTPDFPPGTGGIQLLAHRMLANARSLEVRVLTPDCPGAAEHDRGEALAVTRTRRAGGSQHVTNLLLNGAALRAGLAFRPDVVLSLHIVTSPAARAIHALTGAPVAQYVYAKELPARPRLARFAVRSADATVAISAHSRELALSAGADPGRVELIPPGVDLDGPLERRPAPTPTIVTVSRLADIHKGHDVLVRALPLIRERVPGARWVVVGDGPLRPRLEEEAERAGVADAIEWAGRVSDAERGALLAQAHVFAMPSRLPPGAGGEGFGIVYLEANAAGLPVVAGDVGGALDAVVHGQTGLLVDPEDERAVAAAVADLLLDPERAARMGRAGAERAAGFAWPLLAQRLEELLAALAAQRNGSVRA